jgi:glycosyltransferase involved in cell wall biosynthesis
MDITVLILTRNEIQHIERCIINARRVSPHIIVVDSNSADGTAQAAESLGVQVINHSARTFSEKLIWCLDNLSFQTEWVLRLDADEELHPGFLAALQKLEVNLPRDVNGYLVRRQLWFMGSWIRWGGMYPTYSLRLWRKGMVQCEGRLLDEHLVLKSGQPQIMEADIIDNPLISLADWIGKHNQYSTLEAESALTRVSQGPASVSPKLWGSWAERRRWYKERIFYRMPPFLRPSLYFLYRYLFQLGFLDGRNGFIFHFMHGFWYRMLVDAKIIEAQAQHQNRISGKP